MSNFNTLTSSSQKVRDHSRPSVTVLLNCNIYITCSSFVYSVIHPSLQIREVTSLFDRSLTDQFRQVQSLEAGTSQQIAGLDSKTRSTTDGMKAAMLSYRQTELAERDKLEARLLQHIDRLMSQRDDRLVCIYLYIYAL